MAEVRRTQASAQLSTWAVSDDRSMGAANSADGSGEVVCWRITAAGELSGGWSPRTVADERPGGWSVLGWAGPGVVALWRRSRRTDLRILRATAGSRPVGHATVVGRPLAGRIAASGRAEWMVALATGDGRAVPCLYVPADETYLPLVRTGGVTALAAWDADQGLAVLDAETDGMPHVRLVWYRGGEAEEVALPSADGVTVLNARGHGAGAVGLTGRTRQGDMVPGTLDLTDTTVRWHDALTGHRPVDVSPSGRRLLVSTWAEERNVYSVVGPDGDRVAEIRPDGVATKVVFTADERHLVGWNQSPASPPSIVRWDIGTGAARSALGRTPRHDLSWTHRWAPDRDGRNLPEWVVRPRNGRGHGTVLHLHGGPRGRLNQTYEPVIAELAGAGWTVVGMNYPGSAGYGPEFEGRSRGNWGGADAGSVEWRLRALRHENPGPVCVYGQSYGGYLALLLLAAAPEAIDATAVWAPVTDLPELLRTSAGARRRWLEEELGDLRLEPAQLVARSPVAKVAALRDRHLLVGHGLLDDLCPVEQSRRLARALGGPRTRPGRFEYLEDATSSHTPTVWHTWTTAVVGRFERVRAAT